MKGYYISYGYMGYMPKEKRYRLFTNEAEYLEIFEEDK